MAAPLVNTEVYTAPRRHLATWVSGVGMLVLTLPFVLSSISVLRLSGDATVTDEALRARMVQVGVGTDVGSLLVGAVVTLLIASLVVVVAVGVLLRYEWGRTAGLVVIGGLALFTLPVTLAGMVSGVSSSAATGFLIGLGDVVVLVLLARHEVGDDIDRATFARTKRRVAGI